MSQQKPKLPLPKYIVLKKMIVNGRRFWPPRIVALGRLEYDVVGLPADKAAIWNHTGCITNYEKFHKGTLVHPDSIKV